MVDSYLAAVAALALLTILPGPDFAMVARFAVSRGRDAGVRVALGVVAGLALWGVMAVVGLAAVLAASSVAYEVVKIAGAIFLVGMGVRALWHSRKGVDQAQSHANKRLKGNPFRSGLFTNLLNPKIAVFYTSLLPSLVPGGESPHLWLPVLVVTHLVLSVAWLVGYAVLVSKSKSVMDRPKARVILERITGSVLVGLGLRVAAEAR